jgi:hypothetical protein
MNRHFCASSADLIALQSASIGRACLEARQKFAIEVFEVIGRDNYASAMKTRDVRQRVIVATLLEKYAGKTPKEVQLT